MIGNEKGERERETEKRKKREYVFLWGWCKKILFFDYLQ